MNAMPVARMLKPRHGTTRAPFLLWVMTQVCRNRLFEWAMAGIMLWLGIKLLQNPGALEQSTFRMILAVCNARGLTVVFMALGLFRLVALSLDGRYLRRWTPQMRSLAAGLAALIWFEMGLALELLSYREGVATIGSPVYFGLMLAEIFSAYRPLARDRDGG